MVETDESDFLQLGISIHSTKADNDKRRRPLIKMGLMVGRVAQDDSK